ncbi:MAG: hypothetical protein JWR90_2 [Marmoricola sp.]|nr:hypothetical protein [Marmoricola sp.]
MSVSVRHNSRLAAFVALAAAVITVAWFSRALQTGAWSDWLWCVVVASIGVLQLLVVRDGRAPLMVADEHGVRVRRGETWSGLRWQDIEHVEVQSPASWLRDGQVVVHPVAGGETGVTEAYVVPLAMSTKVDYDGLTGDLVGDLDALASGRVPVLVVTRLVPETPERTPQALEAVAPDEGPQGEPTEEPESEPAAAAIPVQSPVQIPVQGAQPVHVELMEHLEAEAKVQDETEAQDGTGAPQGLVEPDPTEKLAKVKALRGRWAGVLARLGASEPTTDSEQESGPDAVPSADETDEIDETEETEPEFAPVDPARETRPAARAEVRRESVRMLPTPPAIPAQRSADTTVVVARVDDYAPSAPQPAPDAMIGPMIAAARNRARLSIDTLSERTRIRPHVLESIEVDDFEACGGDFYARGHLRTLARVFGLDPEELLDLYDEHYAKAEIDARQVFEAELATGIGGGVRATYTGPRWSLLAACVLALAGVWGVARVFNDTPQELVSPAPNVVDSAGLAKADPAETPKMTLATLEVAAAGDSPQVVIRDRDGKILWAGKLADGQHQQIIGLAPFDVTASIGRAVKVSYLGKAKGSVGDAQAAASRQFGQ